MLSLLQFLAILIALSSALSDATTPLVVPWNTTKSYGPDGPWSVITIQVGSGSDTPGNQPISTVDLHPGGIWESMILRKSFCNDNGTIFVDYSSECLAAKAGLYDVRDSTTVQPPIGPGLVWQWGSSAVENVAGMAINMLDTITVPAVQGAFTVYNSTISAVQAWQIQLPDRTWYSAQVGTLSLGAPGTGVEMYNATDIGQTVPGFAYNKGATASNSWGLHYGSASLGQEGSLVFGGYDQSRALGDMGIYDLGGNNGMIANLLDVQIGVEIGPSPFSERSYTGLLKMNATFQKVQPAVINPIVPYLFMSPETCAAVTEELPVSFNSQIGLYLWNTADPRYERIIKSPTYLAFLFQSSKSGNFTIKVPFRLLNLTLEAPIVNETQQYFPCRPFYARDSSRDYYLGKAFLQAAFIGVNWQSEKFFVAQAPGPGVGAPNIQSIRSNDVPIATDPIENFATTWARDWTVLSDTDDSGNTTQIPTKATNEPKNTSASGNKNLTVSATSLASGTKASPASGLASRTKAGIAGGAVAGAFAIAGVLLLYCSRRRRVAVLLHREDVFQKEGTEIYEKYGRPQASELGMALPHEADASHQVHEVGMALPHEADASHQIHELGPSKWMKPDLGSSTAPHPCI